jgi:ACS family hexuronate transporter-like MFS transporter
MTAVEEQQEGAGADPAGALGVTGRGAGWQVEEKGSEKAADSPVRWVVVSLLFLAAVLNYVDKNTLSLLAPTIQKDLGFSDQVYANIQNVFQVAYTVALLGSGFVVDKMGPRVSLALFVGWWSAANVLTGFVRSVTGLGVCRGLLGLGEAGNWTASPKAVSECFKPRERGLAIGIYSAGSPVGMTLAPILIIAMAGSFGWRSTFVLTGVLGLLWVVPWVIAYRLVRSERGTGAGGSEQALALSAREAEAGWSFGMACTQPAVWALLLGRLLSDPVWFFYQNWYPKYLVAARGFDQKGVQITAVLFLAAGIGSMVGGAVAGRLIRRGSSPQRARMLVMGVCALVMPISPLVAKVPGAEMSIAIASVVTFAHLAWLTNISALVVDVVPSASLGKVFGLVAAGSSVGAILMNDFVGRLVKSASYDSWYVIAGFLHPLALVILLLGGLARSRQRSAAIG